MNHKELSSKGGKARSPAKTRAARENWKKALAKLKRRKPIRKGNQTITAVIEQLHGERKKCRL